MRGQWRDVMKRQAHFLEFSVNKSPARRPIDHFENFVFNPGKELAICTLSTPEITGYAAEAEKSILSYCLKNDYTAYIYRKSFYPTAHPSWGKGRALLNHIDSHKYMVWMDSDTLILRQDQRIFESIASTSPKMMHVAIDYPTSWCPYNNGVFFFRTTPDIKNLLTKWDEFSRKHLPKGLYEHGGDQRILCNLLLEWDPSKNMHQPHEMAVFDTEPNDMTAETTVLHFMGFSKDIRILWMNYWNSECLSYTEQCFLGKIKPL